MTVLTKTERENIKKAVEALTFAINSMVDEDFRDAYYNAESASNYIKLLIR